MKTQEWNFPESPRFNNRERWPAGPWDNEPDKKQWTDTKTGLPCLIVRNALGGLCGYVGVSKDHPWFKKDYGDLDAEVHGGLTFSKHCTSGGDKEHGICHIVEPGEDDNVWWLGFDCIHGGDASPGMLSASQRSGMILDPPQYDISGYHTEEIYRDFAYVTEQTAGLAAQAKVASS